MSDETLKPCPFCGKQPEVGHYETFDNDEWYIGCDCECGPCTKIHLTYEQAIAAWNARAERTCYADEVTHRDCKYSVNRGWKERTCKQEERGWGTEGDHARVWLTCGHDCMVPTVQDLPNYCPNCGARVVE